MNSTGRTAAELLSTTQPENLTTSQPTIVTRRDNRVQPEGLRTISQTTTVSDSSKFLAKNASNPNVPTRGESNAAVSVDASQNLAMTEDCGSILKSLKSISSQFGVAAVPVVASKVLHENQLTSEGAAASALCPSLARSGNVGLGLCCCDDDDAAAASPPSASLFADSENENPARTRRDECLRHSFDSIPTPRAPMKPTRVKSLNTLFPGKTRRRLDFDHL